MLRFVLLKLNQYHLLDEIMFSEMIQLVVDARRSNIFARWIRSFRLNLKCQSKVSSMTKFRCDCGWM